VDRSSAEVELRPVFLVAMAEETKGQGHLIFGSTPSPDLAAQYGASLGASHVLVGTYDETVSPRRLDVQLVDVNVGRVVSARSCEIAAGELHRVEDDVAEWLGDALGANVAAARAALANDDAYSALLEAMDDEVNATLLRQSASDR